MRLLRLLAMAVAILACASPAPANAAFGLKDIEVAFSDQGGDPIAQAGAHPYEMNVDLNVNTFLDPKFGLPAPEGAIKDLFVTQIPGLAGNPTAVPPCASVDFLTDGPGGTNCAPSSALGTITIHYLDPTFVETTAVYNLEPPPGKAAKLGFSIASVRVTIEVEASSTPPYNLVARSTNIANVVFFYGAELTLWGVPADPAHDAERGGPAGIAPVPFLTLPRSCEGPIFTGFEAFSWEGESFAEEVLSGGPLGMTECGAIGFSPEAKAKPTTDQAESPTGLDFSLKVEDEGLANPSGIAEADIRKAEVTLPEGMTLNPSVAEGLAVCTPAQFEAQSIDSPPGQGCPQAAKVGTVQATTPLLEGRLLQGSLYVAQQDDPATTKPGAENPFDSLIALYMIIREPQLGLFFKLAGKVEPDPTTGQIVTSFDDLPPYPLGEVDIRLREGGRSPLITPPRCGSYETEAIFTPSANPGEPLQTTSGFEITKGVGGGPCPPGGTPPFGPGFEAGTLNNSAATHSPFLMRLTRRDGDQDLTKFSATLPPGLVAKLAGTSLCPDRAIAAARAKSGRAELADPSCPDSSRIGSVLGGAGVGSQLTYAKGSVYLSGPTGGAPLSVIGIVPAVAGPFDVGTVAVRQALRVNPRTGIVTVDGEASDPIPHILAGIPLRVREIRVAVDKPQFTLNPTSCDPATIGAELWGGGADVFSTSDDSPFGASARFQAADCASLGFKPRLELKLKGGTKRGGHPALKGTFRPRAGDANLKGLVLRLPRSAFLDQAHIRTICTRVQFAANGGNGAGCPAGAIYGKATAYTPILDQPLTGPVYLRSSDNNLPDFVAALEGLVDVEAVARIDSVRGGIRATFEDVPDAPLSKVVVEMQGARKGLIVNSKNLCAGKNRGNAQMVGQNGRRAKGRPVVRAQCG